MPSLVNLKSHLIEHNHQQQQLQLMANNEDDTNNNNNSNKNALASQNPKLSSIIASAKNISAAETTNKKNSFVINIPQTMKVFNVKEILSKLKSHTEDSTLLPNNDSSKVSDENFVYFDHQFNNKTSSFDDAAISSMNVAAAAVATNTSIIQLEDFDDKLLANDPIINEHISIFNRNNQQQQQQLPYHYSEFENIYICNLCNCTYDSLRSIKAHLWKHSGHHKFSYPIHDYNNRIADATGKPITTLSTKPPTPLSSNSASFSSPSTYPTKAVAASKFQLEIDTNKNSLTTPDLDEHLTATTMSHNSEEEKPKCKKLKSTSLVSSSSSKRFSSPISSFSPVSSTSPSNSHRSNDGSSGNVSCASASGGGICSVLLEVIEKLRDAESSSLLAISQNSQNDDSDSNKIKLKNCINNCQDAAAELSGVYKKRKKASSQLINSILNGCSAGKSETSVPMPLSSDIQMLNFDSYKNNAKHLQHVGVKKQRKKRISKKLNQLIAMNCTTSNSGINNCNKLYVLTDTTKESRPNKISTIIESQTNLNHPICINNASSSALTIDIASTAASTNTSSSSPPSSTKTTESTFTEECTIETSIVNSLYDDDVSILNNFDLNQQVETTNANLNENNKTTNTNTSATRSDSTENDNNDDVDFNFSYKNHNGVLLNDLNIKLIENENNNTENQELLTTSTDNTLRSFLCFKCSLFFEDLLALCEHKSNCEKNYEQLTESNQIFPSNRIKYFLCDLCHSKDPLHTVMSESSSSNRSTSSKMVNSYYLLNISEKKFYFKCFSDLDSIIDHFKSEHQQHLPCKSQLSAEDNNNYNANPNGSVTEDSSQVKAIFENGHGPSAVSDKPNLINNKNLHTTDIISPMQCNEIKNLLESLATNDGHEQYVCCLCNYVCFHLPSLKSHMWTHVKHEKFDYSINTSIINAALDYENKLNRNLSSINSSLKNDLKAIQENHQQEEQQSKTDDKSIFDSSSSSPSRIFLEKKLASILEMINYSETKKKLSNLITNNNKPMVLFRCSKCHFETIDLCLLRLHKQEHYIKLNENKRKPVY
jgi:hypothetical protein